MEIQQPLWLMALLPFLLLLWFRTRHQKAVVAAKKQFRRPHFLDIFLVRLRKLSFIVVFGLIAFALAAPLIKSAQPPDFFTETRTMYLCVDTSTSMGSGPDSAMEKIKVLTEQFAKRRHEAGDYVGISAYSGHASSARGGAAVIMRPTRDWESIKDAIAVLHSQLLGAFTAIGEGIWTSVQSIVREDVIKNNLDFELLRQSVESIGTDHEDPSYVLRLANQMPKQNDKVIVVFTDGYYNTGIEPAKPLWMAKRLGIRVYFIAFNATGPTGLSKEEGEKRKQILAQGVALTGGQYFESSDIQKISSFYDQIDRMEKGKIIVKTKSTTKEDYEKYVFGAIVLLFMFVCSEGRLKI